ncbi:M48 family metalloprotease [Thalassotalea sp. 1_MG-2023]|uniref:beta-barrel assembly-enhancing protease n=1 Tax=Thalassotalea sp. 1_MG-2023 TaxID=3062680 RepID=UPI0026E1E494|nr:M48 family metalloprotease [Thalassotalea sp. 1_MG-2023]MDO6428404.1 M48 family metalloprotease [Thalassotalea sp. 1_MG-2023]
MSANLNKIISSMKSSRSIHRFCIKPILHSALISYALFTTHIHGQENNRNALPDIGAAGISVLSIEKERQVGDAMMRQLRATQPIVHDPILNEYINDLGNRMVRNANDVNYSFKFFFLNNQELNAFAFFGGHIGIHTGLLAAADTESELASVVAHEISHITQRHLARRIETQQQNQTLSTAGLISGVLLTLINPTVGMAALSTSMAASQQAAINYTRGNEKEADRVGIRLLVDSGFDPMGAPNFFGKMAETYRYTSKPPAMLLTHPLPESRISDARVRAQNYNTRNVRPSLAFHLAKARIEARYQGEAKNNILTFKKRINKKQYAFKAAAEYALAVAYFENKEYEKSQQILLDLLAADEHNLFYIDVLTDIYINTKKFDAAFELLSKLNKLMPNNQVVALNYSNALIEAEKYAEAETLLEDYLILQPDSYIAHDLLVTVYRKQKKMAMMHATKAEILALLGGFSRAVDELQTGYNFADESPLIRKRIKARILQFQSQEEKLKRLSK